MDEWWVIPAIVLGCTVLAYILTMVFLWIVLGGAVSVLSRKGSPD